MPTAPMPSRYPGLDTDCHFSLPDALACLIYRRGAAPVGGTARLAALPGGRALGGEAEAKAQQQGRENENG